MLFKANCIYSLECRVNFEWQKNWSQGAILGNYEQSEWGYGLPSEVTSI